MNEWIITYICICLYTHTLTHTHNEILAIKNEILPFTTTWINLFRGMLSEISQTEKDKYHMISLVCNIKKKQNK